MKLTVVVAAHQRVEKISLIVGFDEVLAGERPKEVVRFVSAPPEEEVARSGKPED
jgi:hypothetical protein